MEIKDEKRTHCHEDFFLQPSLTSDAILKMDGKKYYVNKAVLSLASPVFLQMLSKDFKGEEYPEVELPDKSSSDILELLLCVYPSILKSVTMDNWDGILTMCEEYQIDHLRQRCEEMAVNYVQTSKLSKETVVHMVYMAEVYGLDTLLTQALNAACFRKQYGRGGLSEVEEFRLISRDTLNKLAKIRLQFLERKLFDEILESNLSVLNQGHLENLMSLA